MLDESSVAAFSQLGASFFAAARARLAEPRADATWMLKGWGRWWNDVKSIGTSQERTAGTWSAVLLEEWEASC